VQFLSALAELLYGLVTNLIEWHPVYRVLSFESMELWYGYKKLYKYAPMLLFILAFHVRNIRTKCETRSDFLLLSF